MASTYHFADAYLEKAEYPKLMASGVLLQLSFLGGKEWGPPVVIRDGLSPETVEAIRADLKRSYDQSVELKPGGPRKEKKA